MKARYGSLALALLLVSGSAWADDDDDEDREDPWAYDQAKSERRQQAEEEERESERSFGSSGEFAISAERLVSFARTGRVIKQDGPDQKDTVTRLNLLLNENADVLGYSAPRLAFDVFVMDGLSIGGALGFSSVSGDLDQRQVTVAPRFGYALMFGEVVGIWPRVGVTYQDQKTAEAKVGILAGTVELPLVLVPAPQALITIGPSLDFTLVGKYNPTGPVERTNYAQDELGFSAGLTLFF